MNGAFTGTRAAGTTLTQSAGGDLGVMAREKRKIYGCKRKAKLS
jgi:hypothetical protein